MSEGKAQAFWVPSGATLRLPPRMRLARAERERLWKGLERFVNCGDDLADYEALGRAFPDFWPVEIWHYPNYTPPAPVVILGRLSPLAVEPEPKLSEQQLLQKMEHEGQVETLNWHPACYKLFLFYRDMLRSVWRGEQESNWLAGGWEEFLLGLSDHNERAHKYAENGLPIVDLAMPFSLFEAWREVCDQFRTAAVEGRVEISMLWGMGDFYLVPHNDFQRAFYLLFRQNWRARVCPRCKMFFVARKPKQIFCGTGCSAGNRLASKRKWWNRVGAKRRARQRQRVSKRSRREKRR